MNIVINYWSVLLGGVLSMAFGALWYSPVLFGNLWAKLSGLASHQMDDAEKKSMIKTYILHFIFILIGVYVLAHFIALQDVETVPEVLTLGFWIWLGFQTPVVISSLLWEKKPFTLFILNATHNIIALWISGITLVLF